MSLKSVPQFTIVYHMKFQISIVNHKNHWDQQPLITFTFASWCVAKTLPFASGWWLGHPSEKYERQLGWLATQYFWENKKWQPNHQPDHDVWLKQISICIHLHHPNPPEIASCSISSTGSDLPDPDRCGRDLSDLTLISLWGEDHPQRFIKINHQSWHIVAKDVYSSVQWLLKKYGCQNTKRILMNIKIAGIAVCSTPHMCWEKLSVHPHGCVW